MSVFVSDETWTQPHSHGYIAQHTPSKMWRRINGIFIIVVVNSISFDRITFCCAWLSAESWRRRRPLPPQQYCTHFTLCWNAAVCEFGSVSQNKIDLSNTKIRFITREHVIYTQNTYTTLLRAHRSYIYKFWLLFVVVFVIIIFFHSTFMWISPM